MYCNYNYILTEIIYNVNRNGLEFDIIWNKLYTSYWKDEVTYSEITDTPLPSLEESSY